MLSMVNKLVSTFQVVIFFFSCDLSVYAFLDIYGSLFFFFFSFFFLFSGGKNYLQG